MYYILEQILYAIAGSICVFGTAYLMMVVLMILTKGDL
jgi:hypothetical protein